MLSVGVDLTSPSRFAFIASEGGQAFYRRAFTSAEQLACGHTPHLVAICFAGKEAVSKLLGTGLGLGHDGAIPCRSIEILDLTTCEPKVNLIGPALELSRKLGIEQIFLRRDMLGDRVVVFALGGTGISPAELRGALLAAQRDLLSAFSVGNREIQ